MPDLETKIVEYMRPLFGEFAATAFAQQKAKLGMGEHQLTAEQYLKLAEEIRSMCNQVAGPTIADRVYTGLVAIVREG
jgi:hypothetical protein